MRANPAYLRRVLTYQLSAGFQQSIFARTTHGGPVIEIPAVSTKFGVYLYLAHVPMSDRRGDRGVRRLGVLRTTRTASAAHHSQLSLVGGTASRRKLIGDALEGVRARVRSCAFASVRERERASERAGGERPC